MAQKERQRATRLGGNRGYSYRGRVVRFAKLPKREQRRFRKAWAKKARATKRRVARLAPKVKPYERKKLKGEMKRRGMRVFAADRKKGIRVRRMVSEVFDLAKEEYPEHTHGAWLAEIEWPEDERSTRGRPWVTRISRSPATGKVKTFRWSREWFDDVDEHPAAIGPLSDEHPSRGYGRGKVISVHYMAFVSKRYRGRKTVRR